jgi:hypothetical protein
MLGCSNSCSMTAAAPPSQVGAAASSNILQHQQQQQQHRVQLGTQGMCLVQLYLAQQWQQQETVLVQLGLATA